MHKSPECSVDVAAVGSTRPASLGGQDWMSASFPAAHQPQSSIFQHRVRHLEVLRLVCVFGRAVLLNTQALKCSKAESRN